MVNNRLKSTSIALCKHTGGTEIMFSHRLREMGPETHLDIPAIFPHVLHEFSLCPDIVNIHSCPRWEDGAISSIRCFTGNTQNLH